MSAESLKFHCPEYQAHSEYLKHQTLSGLEFHYLGSLKHCFLEHQTFHYPEHQTSAYLEFHYLRCQSLAHCFQEAQTLECPVFHCLEYLGLMHCSLEYQLN